MKDITKADADMFDDVIGDDGAAELLNSIVPSERDTVTLTVVPVVLDELKRRAALMRDGSEERCCMDLLIKTVEIPTMAGHGIHGLRLLCMLFEVCETHAQPIFAVAMFNAIEAHNKAKAERAQAEAMP